MTTWVVCDRCGYLGEPEFRPEPVPFKCFNCGHAALWEFTNLNKALDHSALIRERKNAEIAGGS